MGRCFRIYFTYLLSYWRQSFLCILSFGPCLYRSFVRIACLLTPGDSRLPRFPILFLRFISAVAVSPFVLFLCFLGLFGQYSYRPLVVFISVAGNCPYVMFVVIVTCSFLLAIPHYTLCPFERYPSFLIVCLLGRFSA